MFVLASYLLIISNPCDERKQIENVASTKKIVLFCLVLNSKERICFNYCFHRCHQHLLGPTNRTIPPVSLERLLLLRGLRR